MSRLSIKVINRGDGSVSIGEVNVDQSTHRTKASDRSRHDSRSGYSEDHSDHSDNSRSDV